MLMPADMSRITILFHKKYESSLIKKLHENGLVSIEEFEDDEFEQAEQHPEVDIFASYETRIAKLIDILKGYRKKEKGIKKIFSVPEIRKRKAMGIKLKKHIETKLPEIEKKVYSLQDEMESLQEELDAAGERLKKLELLSLFDIDVSWLGKSKYFIVRAGIVSSPEIKLKNGKAYIRQIDKDRWFAIVIVPASDEQEIYSIKNFEEIYVDGEGKASVLKAAEEKRIKEIESRIEEIRKKMEQLYETHIHELRAFLEEVKIEREEREIRKKFASTEFTYGIRGWCLAEDVERLKKIVDDATNGRASVYARKASRKEKEVPIYLKNPKWAKPFETFVELFSLPKYDEVNPTAFIGVAFVIFFSLMLGDAGYGLVIFILSMIAYFRFKQSQFIREWSFVGIWLGLGNIFTGFLFNSFFGDFIPRFITHAEDGLIYHAEIAGISLPIDAIHKPVIILAISLILGLIHLNTGLLLAVYQNLKRKNYKAIVEEQFAWFALQIGGGMLIGSDMLDLWKLSSTANIVAVILTIVGLIFVFKKGPLGFFDITGYLGDWLSYARLTALGLATAGMALAFNIVAELIPSLIPYIGAILLPLILVVAHFANLIIQALGAVIHSLRLQYVEFFNRFYEGGGKKFIPFRIVRKYTEER
ncbi:MAG: V-type ATP synthase subunit I [Thermoplasmata archaeon]|nr:V-type ATP synthase subunit I [Thermoplasmata archaeon]